MLGAVLLIALAIRLLSRGPLLSVDPLRCIPPDAGLVIALPKLTVLWPSGDSLPLQPWRRVFRHLPGVAEDLALLQHFNESVDLHIAQSSAVLVLVATPGDRLGLSCIIDLPQLDDKQLPNHLASLGQLTSSRYRSHEVYTLTLTDGRSISAATYQDLLIIGRLPLQVEQILAGADQKSDWLTDLGRPAADALLSIYSRTDAWPALQKVLLQSSAYTLADNWANWWHSARIDVMADEEGYRLSGNIVAADRWLEADRSKTPMDSSLRLYLPATTAAVTAVNLPGFAAYTRQHDRGSISRFAHYMFPVLSGQGAMLTLRPYSAALMNDQLWMLHLRDPKEAEQALNNWMSEVGVLESVNYQGFSLTRVNEHESVYPWGYRPWRNPWWTLVGPYLLLANEQATLEGWIDQYAVGSTLPLTKAGRFLLPETTGPAFTFFWDWGAWRTALADMLKDPEIATAVSNLGQLSIGVASQGERAELSGHWLKTAVDQRRQGLSWRLALPVDAAAGPWILATADDGQSMLVQDKRNRLYLADQHGDLLWQKQLSGPIHSDVQAVRLPQAGTSGTYAWAFSTLDHIYLIDEQGNDLSDFPVPLRHPATAGMTVVDFGEERDYALFVPAADSCVYAYDLSGRLLSDWAPKCGLGKIDHAILHFQHQHQDFLVAANDTGLVQAFGRQGELRLQAATDDRTGTAALAVQLLPGYERIIRGSLGGRMLVLPLAGEPFQISLPTPGSPTPVHQCLFDLIGDPRLDYLYATQNHLYLRGYEKNALREQVAVRTPTAVDALDILQSSRQSAPWIATFDRQQRLISLWNMQGELLHGFPLAADRMGVLADLFDTGEWHLMVSYGHEVLAYRLGEMQ